MSDKDSILIFEAWNRRDFLKTLGKAAAAATTPLPLPKSNTIPVKAGANPSFAPVIANDTNMYSNILYKTIYQKMQSTKDKLNVDDNMVKRVADAAYEAIKNDKRRYEKYVDSIDIYQSVSPSEPMSFDEFVAEADVHFSDIDEYYIMSKALKSKNDVEDVVKDVIDKDDDRDYVERDYASGPHMNSYKNEDNRRIIREMDLSRREFFKKLGLGTASAVTFPWTKLLSSPALANTIAAPFKIGAGSMLNPDALYKFYRKSFEEKATDFGIYPVDKMMAGGGEDEIPRQVIGWVAKNFVDNYVADIQHKNHMGEVTIAPTVGEHLGNDTIEVEDLPEWASNLVKRGMEHEDDEHPGYGRMNEEDYKRYRELMDSKWFDASGIDQYDYELEEIQGLMLKWMGIEGKIDMDAIDEPVLEQVFDYISNLIHHEGYSLDQIYKMDFKNQILPGVAEMITSNDYNLDDERETREPDDEDYDKRDYLERDYASGPHMNSYNIMSNSDSKMIYEAYAKCLNR